jgi:hypothetical protein
VLTAADGRALVERVTAADGSGIESIASARLRGCPEIDCTAPSVPGAPREGWHPLVVMRATSSP